MWKNWQLTKILRVSSTQALCWAKGQLKVTSTEKGQKMTLKMSTEENKIPLNFIMRVILYNFLVLLDRCSLRRLGDPKWAKKTRFGPWKWNSKRWRPARQGLSNRQTSKLSSQENHLLAPQQFFPTENRVWGSNSLPHKGSSSSKPYQRPQNLRSKRWYTSKQRFS